MPSDHAMNDHQRIAELAATLAWVRANYAGGNTKEINARIDAALVLARSK